MALSGVLRPGYVQVRVTDIDAALRHYADRVGLHEVSREPDGRVYLRAWDEFDRHSIVLRPADSAGDGLRGASRWPTSRTRHLCPPDRGTWHRGRGSRVGGTARLRASAEFHRPYRASDRIVFRDGTVRGRADDANPEIWEKNPMACGSRGSTISTCMGRMWIGSWSFSLRCSIFPYRSR